MVDLRTCQPGQKLRLRDNRIADYIGASSDLKARFRHSVAVEYRGSRYDALYTDNGQYFSTRIDLLDVVEILEAESSL